MQTIKAATEARKIWESMDGKWYLLHIRPLDKVSGVKSSNRSLVELEK